MISEITFEINLISAQIVKTASQVATVADTVLLLTPKHRFAAWIYMKQARARFRFYTRITDCLFDIYKTVDFCAFI